MSGAPPTLESAGQLDLFKAKYDDAPLRSDIFSLEHPFFVLSKQRFQKVRVYEYEYKDKNKQSVRIEVIPLVNIGAPTQWDKDVLIYAQAQLTEGIKLGQAPSRTLKFNAHAFLTFTRRGVTGRDYNRLKAALTRLRGTTIRTSIKTGGKESIEAFGFIEQFKWQSSSGTECAHIEITLSEWLYRAVLQHQVLALNKRYFELGGALTRRLYEIVRKHCGTQRKWAIGFELLQRKIGSQNSAKNFKHELKVLVDGLRQNGRHIDRTANLSRASSPCGQHGVLLDYIIWLPPRQEVLVAYFGDLGRDAFANDLKRTRVKFLSEKSDAEDGL
ncbi:MAG: Replication initiator protein [Nevskia sp.]|nr:Replication initiator protein [Nevskia sp.]